MNVTLKRGGDFTQQITYHTHIQQRDTDHGSRMDDKKEQ